MPTTTNTFEDNDLGISEEKSDATMEAGRSVSSKNTKGTPSTDKTTIKLIDFENVTLDVLDSYIKDRKFAYKNIKSFDTFITSELQTIFDILGMIVMTTSVPREAGKTKEKIKFTIRYGQVYIDKPMKQTQDRRSEPLYPHEAISRNLTYEGLISIDLTVTNETSGEIETFPRVPFFYIPMMVKSSTCNLSNLTVDECIEHNECSSDYGGYFIVGGAEKVIVTQMRMAYNNFNSVHDAKLGKILEYRTYSEESGNNALIKARFEHDQIVFDLPFIEKPIPAGIILTALDCDDIAALFEAKGMFSLETSDEDEPYKEYLINIISDGLSHTSDEACAFIASKSAKPVVKENRVVHTRTKIITTSLFLNLGTTASNSDRILIIVDIIKKLIQSVLPKDHYLHRPTIFRDNLKNKRVEPPGILLREILRKLLTTLTRKSASKEIGKTTFTASTVVDNFKKLGEKITSEMQKRFKSANWDLVARQKANAYTRTGVSQPLSRLNHASYISHLMRLMTQLGKESKATLARQVENSHPGFICSFATPESPSVGIVLELLSTVEVSSFHSSAEIINFLGEIPQDHITCTCSKQHLIETIIERFSVSEEIIKKLVDIEIEYLIGQGIIAIEDEDEDEDEDESLISDELSNDTSDFEMSDEDSLENQNNTKKYFHTQLTNVFKTIFINCDHEDLDYIGDNGITNFIGHNNSKRVETFSQIETIVHSLGIDFDILINKYVIILLEMKETVEYERAMCMYELGICENDCGTNSHQIAAQPSNSNIIYQQMGVGGYNETKIIPALCKITVNGICVGYTKHFLEYLLNLRQMRAGDLFPRDISIVYNEIDHEINIYSEDGRLMRPFFALGKFNNMNEFIEAVNGYRIHDAQESHVSYRGEAPCGPSKYFSDKTDGGNNFDFNTMVDDGIIQFLDTVEIENWVIATDLEDFTGTVLPKRSVNSDGELSRGGGYDWKTFQFMEIHPSVYMGVCASNCPYPEHCPSPRNCYQCSHYKQALGIPTLNYKYRNDTTMHIMTNPQIPLIQARQAKAVYLPTGMMCTMAITSADGNNQEDSVVFNKHSIERGLFTVFVIKSLVCEESRVKQIGFPPDEEIAVMTQRRMYDYSKLGKDGIIVSGSFISEFDVLVARQTYENVKTNKSTDSSLIATKEMNGCCIDTVIISRNQEGYLLVQIKIRKEQIPEVGDKFATRTAQKGTISSIMDPENMPFDPNTGQIPDVLFNFHGIPSRMTINTLIEISKGLVCIEQGEFADCTIFSDNSRPKNGLTVGEVISGELVASGLSSTGARMLCNGYTGEMLKCQTFMGPTFYQRLKHLVRDKVHARATGKTTTLVRQPTCGRAFGGGLRFGKFCRRAGMQIPCHFSTSAAA
ncbi:MAG: hypothetical protein JKX76_01845 [Colwellia sp.]|nr:hypothetical protein [Colwellia sp.]